MILTVTEASMRPMLFILVLLALGSISCSKSNYLTVGTKAIVIEPQGLYVRSGPSTKDKKLMLVSYGREFSVLEAGPDEKLFDIKSKWYKVQFRGKSGWLWGGLATPQGKASQLPAATGQCNGLVDYAKRHFKQLSEKDSVTPGKAEGSMDRRSKTKTIEFERGIVGTEKQGYESLGESLKIPGGTVDDGINILNTCVRQSMGCGAASKPEFQRAAYNIKNLRDSCSPSGFENRETRLSVEGNILVLELSDHE